MSEKRYVCVSQSAGPFTKAFVTDRAAFLRRSQGASPNEIRKRAGPAMSRTTKDKLELRLALFGYDGVFYSLTFSDENLPGSFEETRKRWDCFLKRLKRWRRDLNKAYRLHLSAEFDYVYRIEHKHDNWHVHVFLRYEDFPSCVVQKLWDWGTACDVPYNQKMIREQNGFRGLAEYIVKETPEVGRHPWGCNRGLSAKLPKPKITFNSTGRIPVPKDAVLLPVKDPGITEWGVFNFARWLSS